mmetsp:Transcript_36772/g.77498  ORF Transcript_36772/g.77498 Transcript_36772/m.77498 type:complete len:103 (-) Transcript_36772:165-473(-)
MLYLTDKSGPGLSVIEIAARDEALRRAHALLHAVGRTEEWSKDWTSASGQVLSLGEDVLRLLAAKHAALLPLASTCRSLRMLVLPKLVAKKEAAMLQVLTTC